MEARPAPQHHLVAVHVGLQLGHRHDGTVGDIADRARLAVADELGARQRADAVGSDQRRARETAAIGGGDCHCAVAFLETGDHGIRHQLDFRYALAGVEQRVVQVDAVDDDVGVLEPPAERRTGRHAHQLVAGEGIAHQHRWRAVGLLHHRGGDADAVEHVEDVGAELDAIADGAEFGRAFEHPACNAALRERQRGGQPAKPAADDEDRIGFRRQCVPRQEPPKRYIAPSVLEIRHG